METPPKHHLQVEWLLVVRCVLRRWGRARRTAKRPSPDALPSCKGKLGAVAMAARVFLLRLITSDLYWVSPLRGNKSSSAFLCKVALVARSNGTWHPDRYDDRLSAGTLCRLFSGSLAQSHAGEGYACTPHTVLSHLRAKGLRMALLNYMAGLDYKTAANVRDV